MQLSMLYPREGGTHVGDEVGTFNVRAHLTWGILANFEHKYWPRDREVWKMLKELCVVLSKIGFKSTEYIQEEKTF